MTNRVTLSVSLPPALGDFVSSLVDSGRYVTANEVVREGLWLLQQREEKRAKALEALDTKIQAGIDSFERGEWVSADQVFAELYEQLAASVKQEQTADSESR